MPDINSTAASLGSTKRSAEKDFIPELSFAFRDAFSSFLHVMEQKGIYKDNPKFNVEFKEQYPSLLKKQLESLYYKFTVGRYNYLNSLSLEEFLNLVMPFMVTTNATSFYNELKNITLQAAQEVVSKLPTPQQKEMKESKDLKIKVLLDKVLIEAKTSKRIIKEDESEEFNLADESNESNPEDIIKMDIPFLIRVMEYSKEDAQSDQDLHKATEKMIELSQGDKVLSMEDYDSIFASEEPIEETAKSDYISKKIEKLVGEGYPQKQAVTIALSMQKGKKNEL